MAWRCCDKENLLSIESTIHNIVENKKSFIRYGDGEFIIIDGGEIHYQDYNSELQKKLSEILNEYINSNDECNFLLGMPIPFLKCSGFKLSKKRVWVSSWAKARYKYKNNFNFKHIYYGDSFLFSKSYENKYKEIWTDIKSVVFVHNNEIYSKIFQNKYNIETTFVKVPTKNAFSEYDILLKNILIAIEKQKSNKTIVLISAGPTAKVLVYDLSKMGIMAIDTGHCWDDPLYIPS